MEKENYSIIILTNNSVEADKLPGHILKIKNNFSDIKIMVLSGIPIENQGEPFLPLPLNVETFLTALKNYS